MNGLFDNLDRQPAIAPDAPTIGKGIPLRWCQRQDVNALVHAIETSGARRPACIAATGYGKGPIIAETGARLSSQGGKVIVLVDRAHLAHQVADEIERHLDVVCGRVTEGDWYEIKRQCVVSTVQGAYTPNRDGKRLIDHKHMRPEGIATVMVDEGHRFYSPAFRAIVDHLISGGGAACFFTATPVAANGDSWRSFVDWTAPAEGPCMRTTNWCVRQGYLVPPRQAFVRVNINLAAVASRLASEDAENDEDTRSILVDLLRDAGEKNAAKFAHGVARVIEGRKAIIFSPPRVNDAKKLAAWLSATGKIKCEAVWGARPDKLEILNRFKGGEWDAMASVNLLCEGYNDPTVDAAFLCRNVGSWRLGAQMVGRALRPHPSVIPGLSRFDEEDQSNARRRLIADSVKPDALIIDMAGIDGSILQASALDVLYADDDEELRETAARMIAAKPFDRNPDADLLSMEAAREQTVMRQSEQMETLARQRAMAGELEADIQIMDGDSPTMQTSGSRSLTSHAPLGTRAFFVAVATNYDIHAAKAIADAKPANVLRGMTQSAIKKNGGRKDWNRARIAYPEWAAQRKGAA